MVRSEYMRLYFRLIMPGIIAHCNLNDLVNQDVWIYMEIIRGMYGPPQVVIITSNLLTQRLSNHVYFQVKQTLGSMLPS